MAIGSVSFPGNAPRGRVGSDARLPEYRGRNWIRYPVYITQKHISMRPVEHDPDTMGSKKKKL